MGSSLNNILPAVLGGAASLIPGVGAIAGPVVGGLASSIFGGGGGSDSPSGSGGASGGQSPYNVQNSLANLAQMVGPASAAMQVAQSDQDLANKLQNNALGGEGNAMTNAVNSLRSLYSQMPAPASQGLPLSQVSPATLASVMGRAPGLLPRMNSPQQTPYATQIAQMAALPSGQQTFAQPQAALPVTTGSPATTPPLTLNPSYGQDGQGRFDYNGESQNAGMATGYYPTEAAAQAAWFAANPQYASLAPGSTAGPNSTVIGAATPPPATPNGTRTPQNLRSTYGVAA